MNSARIAILTDTGTNTPAAFCAEHDVRTVPLRITFSDGTFESGVSITAPQLVARLDKEIPKTSLPSPETVRAALEQARADGYERAVFVTISSGLSATFQTVKLVAAQMRDFPVVCVDSLSIGVAAGMVVIAATEMIEAGIPFSRLQGQLDALARRTWVFFSTTTLEYLRRGGRISEPIYRLGSMLNLKPVLWCNESGHYAVARKARGWDRALDTEIRLAQEKAAGFRRVRLAICCSDSCPVFDRMEDGLRRELGAIGVQIESIVYSDVSPDLLVHTGPDLVGVGIQGLR